MDPSYSGSHYAQYPPYGDYPPQNAPAPSGGERGGPQGRGHHAAPYGRDNRDIRDANPSLRVAPSHPSNPSPPDLTSSSSYASLPAGNHSHPNPSSVANAPLPPCSASGSNIAPSLTASAPAFTPSNSPSQLLQQQQTALNSTAYLVPAAKPFYPAYNSPLLKNVTTFAETRLAKVYTSFVATFAGFSCFPSQAGVGVNSPSVEIEGHQWCVRIYAAGVDENVGGYVSVYLVHDSDEPIRAGVRITLVNSRYSSDNHVVSTEGDRYMASKGASIGWGKFIHTSSVNRYCIDDV
ncbi:MATH domain-containing protein, partial [archaeon]